MTRYDRSLWIDEFPKSKRPSYPRLREPLSTDVVIIGGGLTGCATAYACAAAGVKVVLVEADQIGIASSGRSTGWIADDPGLSFAPVEKALGRRAARHVWQSWRRASLDFAALVRRLHLKCGLEDRDTLVVAAGAEAITRLKREQKTRREAGLDASFVRSTHLAPAAGLPTSALKSRDGAALDPYRVTIGLADAAVSRHATLFERTAARRIKFNRKGVEVDTTGGRIRAARVVVATGSPTMLFRALRRHFWFDSAYLAVTDRIPAKVRRVAGDQKIVLRDVATPAHVIRWVDEERLMVAGASSETPPDRWREKTIVQRTGQLMYELSTLIPDISGVQPMYGWDSAYSRTVDGLPFVGPHRNYPHHLFAFGDSSPGVTGAFLASRILVRHVLDQADLADEAFGFNRYGHVR